jgi:hypothetical protein
MKRTTRIGVSATPASWSLALRNYARDHATGIEIETLLDPRQLTRPDRTRFHVLVVDDVARIFNPVTIAAAEEAGTFVIGLCDEVNGMGRAYLERLGVQLILPETTRPEELLHTIDQLAPEEPNPVALPPNRSSSAGLGLLSVWYSATGGSGLTEAMISTAEAVAESSRVLVIEADPVSTVLAARLNRSASSGLGWCLNRLAQGRSSLPEGLSGSGEEAAAPLGRFDVICQGAAVTGSAIEHGHLHALVEEALAAYEHVFVAAGALLSASGAAARDRLSLGRALLPRADLSLAWATADPIGAVALGNWRTVADELQMSGQAWALLGRSSRSRFEEQQLVEVIQAATASRQFHRLSFVPEDAAVRRARWDGQLVSRGRWLDSIKRMAVTLRQVPRATRVAERPGSWGLVMAR